MFGRWAAKATITCVIVTPVLGAPSDEAIYRAENACAMAANKIITGVSVGDHAEHIALCNKHPQREKCYKTLAFIREYGGKVPPEFNCK
jgi:hypothetical protein